MCVLIRLPDFPFVAFVTVAIVLVSSNFIVSSQLCCTGAVVLFSFFIYLMCSFLLSATLSVRVIYAGVHVSISHFYIYLWSTGQST